MLAFQRQLHDEAERFVRHCRETSSNRKVLEQQVTHDIGEIAKTLCEAAGAFVAAAAFFSTSSSSLCATTGRRKRRQSTTCSKLTFCFCFFQPATRGATADSMGLLPRVLLYHPQTWISLSLVTALNSIPSPTPSLRRVGQLT